MTNFNPTPNVGEDGQTAPIFTMLVAGKDGSGDIQDITVDTSGNIEVNVNNELATAPITGQAKIAVTSTAVNLPSNTLTNGVIITALTTNAGPITIGGASVTDTVDGTGNGDILEAGAKTSFAVDDTSDLWINGTAGDIISFAGS